MRKLSVPEWCCAIRFNKDENVSVLDDTNTEFTVLKDSYRYWTADPFLFKHNGKYYLFFEMFDRLKRKGLLGCREVSADGCGKLQVIYEYPTHLSYPYIYEENGEIYILPESGQSHELFRLKCVEFPNKWEKEKLIYKARLADSTLFSYNGSDYCISERVIRSGEFNRLDLFYFENGRLAECKNNPLKLDASTARCAGKIFEYHNSYIRPSQDCGVSYGEKLNFNRVTDISKDSYDEKIVKKISVNEIKTNCKNNFSGIHTYNRLDNIEVIDLKIPSNFNLFNIIGAVLKRLFR